MKQYLDTPYFVSEDGGVFRDGKELSTSLTNKGYKDACMYLNSKRKHLSIHRAVAILYVPNPDNKPQVNHIDGNKLNNHYSNLEWVSNRENKDHALENGLYAKGTDMPNSVLTEDDIKYIRENYKYKDSEFGTTGLAKKFNTNGSRIWKIVNNKVWKHLT
jgi:hypothetical protein